MKIDFPVIDIHTHLRNEIPRHTKLANEAGISTVVYMANTKPPLDNVEEIKKSLREQRFCEALPVSAISKNLEGKDLVDIDAIKPFVVGFSDDGKYLENLNLLAKILKKGVLVLAHCSPSFEKGWKNPTLETKFIENYIKVFKNVGGKLHIQHVSKKESVEAIRKAKKSGLKITCETCPHYFTYTRETLKVNVNPPLATKEDALALKQGLADGTIDAIASDYAPEPRITGIDNFPSFIPLSLNLVKKGVLTAEQLKEKLFLNPTRIIGI